VTDPIAAAAGIHAIKKLIDWAMKSTSKDPKLLGMVTDAQNQIIELQQAISERDTKIREQEDELRKLHELGDLEYNDGCYWEKKGDDWDGPFCSDCKDSKGKKIRMKFPSNSQTGETYPEPQCSVCTAWSEVSNPRPPSS
jgi:hypothetical protein